MNARYVVVGTEVHDRELSRRAGFVNVKAARDAATWLNRPDAHAEDYGWRDISEAGDEGPTVEDLLRASEILGFQPPEVLRVIEPLLVEKWNRRKALITAGAIK